MIIWELTINATLAPVSSFPRPQKVPPPVAVPPILVNLSSASTLRTETPEPMVTRREGNMSWGLTGWKV